MCGESLHQPSAEHWGCENGEFACKHSQTTTKITTGNEIKADVANRLALLSARAAQLLVSPGGSCGHRLSPDPPGWGSLPCSELIPRPVSTVSPWICSGASPARRRHQQQLLQTQWHRLLVWPAKGE